MASDLRFSKQWCLDMRLRASLQSFSWNLGHFAATYYNLASIHSFPGYCHTADLVLSETLLQYITTWPEQMLSFIFFPGYARCSDLDVMSWAGYFHFLVLVFEVLVHPFSGQAQLSFLSVLVLTIWALVVNLGQRS